jgi:hypothetical protein
VGYSGGFFSSTKTSHPITDLTAGGTYYIRVMGALPSTSTASTCPSIPHPSFTIQAVVPVSNDACGNAFDITLNNGGSAHTVNMAAASSEFNDEWNACPITSTSTKTAAKDVWYQVNYPDVPLTTTTKFYTEFSISGTAGQQVRLVVYSTISSCSGSVTSTNVAVCQEMTLTGGTDITTFSNLETTETFTRRIQVIPIGTVGALTVSATAVLANNSCEWFQNVLPGFNITTAQTVNFNYASPGNAFPTAAGKDLWYAFDPTSGSSSGVLVYSTSANVVVSGLTSGQTLSLYLYKGNGLSSNNCTNLSADYLSQTNVSANGTFTLTCLDELHGSTDGGYLLRIVQTAGATNAIPTVTVTSGVVGPYNNDCENIWTGTGPQNSGTSNAAHSFSAWHILNGETLTSTFTGATDCNPSINSTLCSGISHTAFSPSNNKDVWFTFKVPDNQCSTLGLTQSSVIDNMKLTYTALGASPSFKDAIIYIYSDCGDANLVDCSGVLDGAGTSWVANGLTQGQNYLVRIKPSSLNSSFDYNFTLKVEDGTARPCNNLRANAANLNVNNCPNYTSLQTYSAKAADDEVVFGEKDVWFTFVAPSPANGNNTWFNINTSWVTVFLESQSTSLITMELYLAGGTVATSGAIDYSVSGVGHRTWGKYGNLIPGATYMIRLRHNQADLVDVNYKIEVYAEGDVTPLSCGENINQTSAKLCGSCGGTVDNQSLCEEWYKMDLLVSTPSNMYWVVEVRGFDQVLDFELRSQHLSETSANEGGEDDYDHPCTSRTLEPSANLVSSTAVDYQVTSGGTYSYVGGEIGPSSCESVGVVAPFGGGFKKVYYGLNGPASGQKDFYYVRVYMDQDDPNYNACSTTGSVGIQVCDIIFKGPYLTSAAANAGGVPNGGPCLPIITNTTFAVNDYNHTLINTPVSGTVIYNDFDLQGHMQIVNTTPVVTPSKGTVVLNANGTYTYTPNTGATGEDSFVYRVCDNGTPSLCDTTVVIINVISSTTNITHASDDSKIGMVNTTLSGNILSNDFDAEGNTVTLNTTPIVNTTHGIVTILASGEYTYTPTTNYVGNDQFTYTICDNGTPQACDTAVVYLTILPIQNSLPSTLISFNGIINEDCNKINWATSAEVDLDHFELERSYNGINFNTISTILPANKNLTINYYSFNDFNRYNGKNYYRLKQVDKSKRFENSNTILLNAQNKKAISIYPNPVLGKLFINNASANFNYKIYNSINQLALEGALNGKSYIDVSQLPAGLYYIKNDNTIIKFIKK